MKKRLFVVAAFFVMIGGAQRFETVSQAQFQERVTNESKQLAPYLWDYEVDMAKMASVLTVTTEDWRRLVLRHPNGDMFAQSISVRELTRIDTFLNSLEMLRMDTYVVPVIHEDAVIGALSVTRINRNIDTYGLLGLALAFLAVTLRLILRDRERSEAITQLSLAAEKHKRRKTEVLLLKRETQLEQARRQESLGRLAAGVAHDFNNILSIILNTTELLAARVEGAHVAKATSTIINAADRAASITKQLLAFGSNQVMVNKPMFINDTITEIHSLLDSMTGDSIRIVLDLAADMPPIFADPVQIERVVLNLVGNAADAMETGGMVKLLTRSEDGCVVFECQDDGTGMDFEIQKRIFEPFFTTKKDSDGTGLGLAMVYGIVHQCGGEVSVDSAPNDGAVFRLIFPVYEGEMNYTKPSEPDRPIRTPTTALNVVLVDDQADLCEVLEGTLSDAGYRVRAYVRPSDAIAHIHEPIDLLITDLAMPEMDGSLLSQKFKAVHPDIRVIIISGYLKEEAFSKNESLLIKPFASADLLRMIRDVVGG